MKRYSFWAIVLLGALAFSGCGGNGYRVSSSNYTFYATGLEVINNGPSNYSIAGVVTINSQGKVTGGEQDYNDGFGLMSPQPGGDKITGGSLTLTAGAQQGVLTLTTNNSKLGVNGTETFAIQIVNDDHGLIIQYDGTATSSGSFDLQTLQTSGTGAQKTVTGPSGNFAFTFTGYFELPDSNVFDSAVSGGIFAASGTSLTNGIVDFNDQGIPTFDTHFTATIGAPDSSGRGTISSLVGTTFATTINYYIVNAQCIRMVVVDPTASFVGSAYSQGTGTFSDSSLVASVFNAISNTWSTNLYSVVGMFTPIAAGAAAQPGSLKPDGGLPLLVFNGVADEDELGAVLNAVHIGGHWAIGSNGYGSLAVTSANLGSVTNFGVYVTDPTLNLNDPNNTTSGTGGALIAEMDTLDGIGVITPQTDTKSSSFTGAYGFGAQVFNTNGAVGWEADFLGQGTITTLALGSPSPGFVNDVWAVLGTVPKSTVTFTGTATADATNVGRYTLSGSNALTLTYTGASPPPFLTTIYQAYGGYLAWIETDEFGMFGGSLQQLTSTSKVEDKPVEHLLAIAHQ